MACASCDEVYFRDIIRRAVNATAEDVVIFTGNGCTGVVHKLIHAMNLRCQATPPVSPITIIHYSIELVQLMHIH